MEEGRESKVGVVWWWLEVQMTEIFFCPKSMGVTDIVTAMVLSA